MFCGQCGTENPNGAAHCKACGAPLANINAQPAPPYPAQPGAPYPTQPMAAPRRIPVKLIGAIAAAVAVIVVLAVVITNSQKTINLDKYLTFETSGYDGYGKLRATVDWDAIEAKYGKKLSFTKAAKQEYGGFLSMTTPAEVLSESVSVELDRRSDLSNGDVVTYSWNVDSDYSDYVKCKLKFKDGTYNIADLAAIGTFDAFADLDVSFDGTAPKGYPDLNYTGSELSSYYFDCEPSSGLSNGDTVTVTLRDDVVESCAEQYGKVPEVMQKQYTVEGLDLYMTKLGDLSADSLAALQERAKAEFNYDVDNNWGSDTETLKSLTYLGSYLQTLKSTSSYGDRNNLFLVYKAVVDQSYTNEDGDSYTGSSDIYWFTVYHNVLVKEDGSLPEDPPACNTPHDKFTVDTDVKYNYSTYYWYYYGYETLDELYQTQILDRESSYNHEDNVKAA